MKRYIVCFSLGVFLAGLACAEASFTGEAGFLNIGEANGDKKEPYLSYTADVSAATPLGPGMVGLALEMQFVIDLEDATGNGNTLGDNVISGYYTQSAGPGELTVSLDQSTAISYWNLEPSVEYGGIDLGFAELGFGLWHNHQFARKITLAAEKTASSRSSEASLALRHPHPDGYDEGGSGTSGGTVDGGGAPALYGGGGSYSDKAGLFISAAFPIGLNVWYGFACGWNKKSGSTGLEITEIVCLDLNYGINDHFRAGLELDDTGKEFKGFTLAPYAAFNLTRSLAAGFHIAIRNLNSASGDPAIDPSIWVKYTFQRVF
jgi:hypothetical protein